MVAALLLDGFGDSGLKGEEVLARMAWMREAVAPRLERYLGY